MRVSSFYQILNFDLGTTRSELVYLDMLYEVENVEIVVSLFWLKCELRLVIYMFSELGTDRKIATRLISALNPHFNMTTKHVDILKI